MRIDDGLRAGQHVVTTAVTVNGGRERSGQDVRVFIPTGYWREHDVTFGDVGGDGNQEASAGVDDDTVPSDVRDLAEELARAASEKFSEFTIAQGRSPESGDGAGDGAAAAGAGTGAGTGDARSNDLEAPRPGDGRDGFGSHWLVERGTYVADQARAWMSFSSRAYFTDIVPGLETGGGQSGVAGVNGAAVLGDVPLPERRDKVWGFDDVRVDIGGYVATARGWLEQAYGEYRENVVQPLSGSDGAAKKPQVADVSQADGRASLAGDNGLPGADVGGPGERHVGIEKNPDVAVAPDATPGAKPGTGTEQNASRDDREPVARALKDDQARLEQERLHKEELAADERAQKAAADARQRAKAKADAEAKAKAKADELARAEALVARDLEAERARKRAKAIADEKARKAAEAGRAREKERAKLAAARLMPLPEKKPRAATVERLAQVDPPSANPSRGENRAGRKDDWVRLDDGSYLWDGRGQGTGQGTGQRKDQGKGRGKGKLDKSLQSALGASAVVKKPRVKSVPKKKKRVAKKRKKRKSAVRSYRKRKKKKKSRRARSRTYVVRRGDSLWKIAKRHYGNGKCYKIIARANRGKIRNPDLILPRQRLVLPKR